MPFDDSDWQERFEIKKSTKQRAGRGVFAKCRISPGDHIGYYTGRTLNEKQSNREPYISSRYMLEICHDCYILGEGKGASFTSFINHSHKPNAQLVISTRWKTARIEAVKRIREGEEIFYDYGDEYWENLGKKPR